MEEKMGKIGLVIEGGGMRGIYGAGVLDRFLEEGLTFPYCIGVSAGSANLVSFLSGQKGRNYRYYKYHAKNKNYMSVHNLVRKGSFFGLEYIYDTLTNNLDALDYDALLATQSAFHIVVTKADTAETVYLDRAHVDYYDSTALMASCAVPVVCRPIKIGGAEYFDGGVTDPIPYKKALEEGYDKLVVILSRRRGFVKRPENFKYLYSRLLQKYPEIVRALGERHRVYNESLAELARLEQDGRAVIIAPSVDVKMSMINNDSRLVDELYDYATHDAEASFEKIYELSR
ncbi:MAG: patatin family protein [Oscillospiraceae bacterium]|nr:patatin family protein [Oscillospiraceae bacterium]